VHAVPLDQRRVGDEDRRAVPAGRRRRPRPAPRRGVEDDRHALRGHAPRPQHVQAGPADHDDVVCPPDRRGLHQPGQAHQEAAGAAPEAGGHHLGRQLVQRQHHPGAAESRHGGGEDQGVGQVVHLDGVVAPAQPQPGGEAERGREERRVLQRVAQEPAPPVPERDRVEAGGDSRDGDLLARRPRGAHHVDLDATPGQLQDVAADDGVGRERVLRDPQDPFCPPHSCPPPWGVREFQRFPQPVERLGVLPAQVGGQAPAPLLQRRPLGQRPAQVGRQVAGPVRREGRRAAEALAQAGQVGQQQRPAQAGGLERGAVHDVWVRAEHGHHVGPQHLAQERPVGQEAGEGHVRRDPRPDLAGQPARVAGDTDVDLRQQGGRRQRLRDRLVGVQAPGDQHGGPRGQRPRLGVRG
jgi:hypothetical protein